MTVDPPRDPAALLNTGTRDRSTHFAVSPHHLASNAATDIMGKGGNAVDGAIAANAVLSVVLPDTCGPGGDLFALIHIPGVRVPIALNASGRAGSGADAAALRAQGFDQLPPQSPWTITVPGCVDGWEALLSTHGSMSLAEVLAPAIGFAAGGFPTSFELAASLDRLQEALRGQGSAPPLYPDGKPPQPGATLRRPRLASTLEAIANEGRDAFYSGRVGAAITEVTSGVITASNLEVLQAEWMEPIGIDVFGVTGWTIPLNSQGYLTLAAAWIFDQTTDSDDSSDAEFQHGLIEAYRAVAWERNQFVSDPLTAEVEPGLLLSTERLAKRVALLDPRRRVDQPETHPNQGGTAFMCTRDAAGTAVALIQSNFHGIGTGLSAGDTGVFLHDRGAGFNLIEGHPNELKAGRRPMHTLSPSLWTNGSEFAAVLGTRGGEFQPQYLIQVAANFFRSGMTPAAAQSAPRWNINGWRSGKDPVVHLESTFGNDMAAGLADKGHDVIWVAAKQPGWGPVSLIAAQDSGVAAAADPRVTTAGATALSL